MILLIISILIVFAVAVLLFRKKSNSTVALTIISILFLCSLALLYQTTTAERSVSPYQNESVIGVAAKASTIEELTKDVRVLCWIMTGPQFHRERADHIMATWAKRCTKYVFVTSEKDDKLPTWVFNVSEGREHLWTKVRSAFAHIHVNFLNDFDWFLKADDNTYVIMENLRHMLAHYNTEDPVYFGERMHYALNRQYVPNGYPSGGSSYILSREAVKRFVAAIPDGANCFQGDTVNEDLEIARCVEKRGVVDGEVRDAEGKHRMIPIGIEQIIFPSANTHLTKWYKDFSVFPLHQGPHCCSDYLISLHYLTPEMLYVYDHFIYNLKVFGRDAEIGFRKGKREIFPGQPINVELPKKKF